MLRHHDLANDDVGTASEEKKSSLLFLFGCKIIPFLTAQKSTIISLIYLLLILPLCVERERESMHTSKTATAMFALMLSLFPLVHPASFISVSYLRRQKQTAFMRLAYSNDPTVASSRYALSVDVTLQNHRPLGCVIEESLASSSVPNHRIVFVASVTPLGSAAQAGLQPGDVIVGVSNSLRNASDAL
jgi:membrane-associated protease RseP (regulator of RpoE activity)